MKQIHSILCLAFCLAASLAGAQVSPPQPASGPDCAGSLPVKFYGSNFLYGTYTVTITDFAGTPRPAASVTPSPSALDAILDLTGLATGAGTITVQGPFTSSSFTFTIVSGGSGCLAVAIYGPSTTAPTLTRTYVLRVMNFGPLMPASETLQLDGIPLSPGMVLNAGAATPVVGTTSQGFQVSLLPLPSGGFVDFSFDLTAGSPSDLVIPSSFTMNAFLATHAASGVLQVSVVGSLDPNEKSGPPGVLAPRFIQGDAPLPYQVSFENDPFASAPAQRVVVTDQLDRNRLDLGTFLFGPITFGSMIVSPPLGLNPFSITVPYDVNRTPSVPEDDVNVQVEGQLDTAPFSPTFGLATWTFQTLDPFTGLPPFDPLVGFLPPDIFPPEGQGMVTFTISPLPTLVTGNRITNAASIVFDANLPILTPIWTNTINKTTPAITCPVDRLGVPTDPNHCTARVPGIAPNRVIASPGVKSLTWTLTGATSGSGNGNASGQVFNQGLTTVTYTVTDLLDRTASCQFLVGVLDTTPPVIANCPANVTVQTGPGRTTCDQVASWTPPTATDNCALASFTSDHLPGDVFPVGTTTVTCTAQDAAGNPATCSFTVTVQDTTPPVLICPSNFILGNDPGACSRSHVAYAAVAVDACSDVTVGYSLAPDSNFPVGTTPVTVTATDAAGNQASCAFTVTVNLTETPGNLYPIALSAQTLAGVAPGSLLPDLFNGGQPGNFGWLTWAGSVSVPTLAASLTPPGDSFTYVNPDNSADHLISVGDWVRGKPGVSNSSNVRSALDVLKTTDINVPVWDQTDGNGSNARYRVTGFAKVRIISYQLPGQNRITARYLGPVCP